MKMMKDCLINQNVYKDLLFLLDSYKDNDMPPIDYLNQIEVKAKIQEENYNSVMEIFLSFIQHRQLLTDFIDYFYCLGKRRDHSDKNSLLILTHILISVLNNNNKDEIINILKDQRCQKVVKFLQFFNKESVIEKLFMVSCQYFEEKYVRDKILLNVKRNKDLLKDVQNFFEEILAQQKAEYVIETTKPITPNITPSMRSPPPVPVNTPEEEKIPTAKPAPKTTYLEPKMSEILLRLKEEHQEASQRLLEEANKATKNLSALKSKPHICSNDSEKSAPLQKRTNKVYKAVKSDIPVKKNAATILREASRLIKEEEKEIQRMNDLVCGAANYSKYEELLDQLRAHEEQSKLEDIERKHLHGLLTREEAILAKQKLLETNKAKRAEIEQEKKETEELLKQMRQKHEEEIKQMIEKTQQIQKNIEARKQDMINKKQMEAQEVTQTTKLLYEEAMLRQRQELERRIEVIKEIKALSNIRDLQENKFDPTETMNIGLLCEMSMAELYERLMIKRTSIKEEIENRQKCIRDQKLKQQQFLADTEQFVEACREQRKMLNEQKDSALKKLKTMKKESQDILELRQKLEKARQKRMELLKY